jgi:general secretion pathway protein E/type IV pilus assembly protein PilB
VPNTTDIATRLLEQKVISEDQLRIALKEQKKSKGYKTIGSILVSMGFVSNGALGEILNETSGIKDFDIKSTIIDSRLVKRIPKEFSMRNKLIALSHKNKVITIGMADVFDVVSLDKVRKFFPPNYSFSPVYIPESDIMHTVDQYYDYEMSIEGIAKELENEDADTSGNEEQLRGDYKSPVVRLVDAILNDAVHQGASDLHFEPENLFLRIRYRVDGKLLQIRSIHKEYWSSIAVRIKIMSGMNIAENRKTQDGRINSEILGRSIDFRVSSQPTIHGENIVMRILDEKHSIVKLENLGFSKSAINMVKKSTKRPEGVIILTGPTGSGKTTTLYSILSYINSIDKNIMTLEDPVEYHLPLIRQSNIKSESGMSFADGIRSLLRQDPDVILVGEIRDRETAVTAIQAAMTGHQVYSSLHTNDAIGAIPRFLDMGVPPYLLVGNLICIVAQRLVRTLCPKCKKKRQITDFEKKILGAKYSEVTELYGPRGCNFCKNSGYKGRMVVSEVLLFDPDLDEMIARSATKREILKEAKKKGFVTLDEDGIEKVIAGFIDIKELMQVVNLTQRF